MPVTDHPQRSRFELAEDGHTAFAAYERDGDVLALTPVVVPPAIEGRGVGTRLVEGVLADIRARGRKVVPQCPFAREYIARHPEERDLLA